MTLEIDCLTKVFGDHPAVNGVSLAIQEGEFFSLLGPSGCGKTTLLRMVGGLEEPNSGEIRHEGRRIDRLPPDQRHFNTVFQRYALFPHLNVRDNVAFGLRMKRRPEGEIRSRVAEMLQLVQMQGCDARHIGTLSGGQQQRIALARALVNHPKVLLLDEPLSALDLKLRQQMQVELRALQRRLRITFIFVTHDQDEALTLSDRVAVMNRGRIEQIGTPEEVYHKPSTAFVARFIGSMNLLEREGSVACMIRPENLRIQRVQEAPEVSVNSLAARVSEVLFQGPLTQVFARTKDGELLQVSCQRTDLLPGVEVRLSWDPANVVRVTE